MSGYQFRAAAGAAPEAPLIFLFHGTGGDENQFFDLAGECCRGLRAWRREAMSASRVRCAISAGPARASTTWRTWRCAPRPWPRSCVSRLRRTKPSRVLGGLFQWRQYPGVGAVRGAGAVRRDHADASAHSLCPATGRLRRQAGAADGRAARSHAPAAATRRWRTISRPVAPMRGWNGMRADTKSAARNCWRSRLFVAQ